MTKNKKTDVPAKKAFVEELKTKGFDARITGAPADITAVRDGQTWYFEIKMTHRRDTYFGAATMTEWEQALKDPDHYRFVVAITDETDSTFEFREFAPAEFMRFSTIPPFKVYFNLDLTGAKKRKCSTSKATPLTTENFNKLAESYKTLNRE